ncbi:Major facilitator superfamily [Macrophomina phaseolina MS6]|uniref:Major facilitator superfamily n=1 Tax=Macrophomina phaseolina (strain MS6) TaxID=1126212 RepID=K2RQB8_MACPH|nr:Major facilitator superfamily [Macrophomina phaseolina MS6]
MADEDPRRLSLSRTKSRPSRPPSPQLHRLYSAQHIDDHSLYDREHAAGESETEDNQHGPPRTASHRTVNGSETEKKDDDGSIEIPEVRDGIPDVRDVEKGDPSREKAKADSPPNDPNVVSWDGPEDPANPKNWSLRRKWAACLVVSSFTFISPVSSSMVAPALTSISKDLGVTKEIEEALMLSIFVLAYAIGPLILGPLSEVYGRVLVLQLANAFYLAWNLGCGFAKSPGQMMAFRFLSGLGGSAPLAIGGGTLSDMFKPEQRGKAISVYSLAPLIGPAAGPIAGGFIAENTTWRWVFWATSICDALIQFVGFFYLQETYAPVLLKWKAARLRKETGNQELRSEFDTDKTISKVLGIALIRPFRLLFTQPIIQFLALYVSLPHLHSFLSLLLNPIDRWPSSTALCTSSSPLSPRSGRRPTTRAPASVASTTSRSPSASSSACRSPRASTTASTCASRPATPVRACQNSASPSCCPAPCSSPSACSGTAGPPRPPFTGSCPTSALPSSLLASLWHFSAYRRILSIRIRCLRRAQSVRRRCCGVWQVLGSPFLRRICIRRSGMGGGIACSGLWRWGWGCPRRCFCGNLGRL